METYDVVVVGLGVVGSSTLYAASRRGLRCCGLEQFELGHNLGSSHGESRIIRKAYFLHPDYVPLLNRVYELWRELEERSQEELMVLNGLVCAGTPDGPFIQGLERCYSSHPLPCERITAAETMKRWPQFRLPESCAVYFDPEGGFLRADRCLNALQNAARANGALIYANEPLLEWNETAIRTATRTLSAKHVILTHGAWVMPEMMRLGVELKIKRKALFWFSLRQPGLFEAGRFPAYICKLNGNDFYGFPTLDGATMKAAEDTGGQWIKDPARVERGYLPEDELELRPLLDATFPGHLLERARSVTCLYTMTADKNFIVGNHPQFPGVTLASCCSGHGFKLGPVMGEVLLETALAGKVPAEAAFLSLSRMLR